MTFGADVSTIISKGMIICDSSGIWHEILSINGSTAEFRRIGVVKMFWHRLKYLIGRWKNRADCWLFAKIYHKWIREGQTVTKVTGLRSAVIQGQYNRFSLKDGIMRVIK
jgi:hypothetical protein